MRLKKAGSIKNKVFNEQDLTELMDFFIALKEEINHPRTDLEFEIRFEDGTTNSGDNKSVFEDTKPIKTVLMRLSNYELNKTVNLAINYLGNTYFVKSDDKDWATAKFVRLEEILNSVKNQNTWFSDQDRQIITSLIAGSLVGSALFALSFKGLSADSNPSDFAIAIFFGLSIFAGIMISIPLLRHLVFNLYPEIEFDTTREHLNKNKKRRSFLWAGITLVALPFAISFISSLIF